MSMTFKEFLVEEWLHEEPVCEEVWVDGGDVEITEDQLFEALRDGESVLFETDEDLFEAAQRAFKRLGQSIKRYYRCKGGPKDGKMVSDPKSCAQRKDPKKVRHGRKIARTKKGVRIRKTAIKKKQAVSRMVARMNARLTGRKITTAKKHAAPYGKKATT